jgi:asparagine synthase (glutamine-hydrolysing)
MCGISGIIFVNNEKIISYKSNVEKMCVSMKDRGPDSSSTWQGRNTVLGHTRLAIMDPENTLADQPVESKNWTLVFNGEIYNFRALKKQLKNKGVNFKTDSDTEVLLYYIEFFGIKKTLSNINGIFAFGAYDKRSDKLHLVRDHLGIKPLYYWFNEESKSFWFSSTPASIVDASETRWNLNYESVFSFFHLGGAGTRDTFFHGIKRLRPAEHLVVDKNLNTKANYYWSPQFREGNLEEKVIETILKEKEAHVESAVFLSGGIDSSVMAAVLSDIKGFHLSSPELKYAQYVAKYLGIQLKVKEYTSDVSFDDLLSRYSKSSGEASASSPIPLMVADLIAEEGFKVAFSANGADELFFGYPRTTSPCLKPENFTALDYEQISVKTDEEQHYHIFRDESAIRIPKLNKPILKQSCNDLYELRNIGDGFPKSTINRWYELQTYIANDLNPTLDFASMACSLEVRVPFLNYELVELALSKDSNHFISADYGRKYPLKKMLKNIGFHPSLWSRAKMGFSIPDEIMRKREKNIGIHREELKERNLFKLGISKQNSARDYIYLNSAIHAFNIWARVWIDSGKVKV